MLAELMLPDQTHMRDQDWTIFFLHKDSNEEETDSQGDGAQEPFEGDVGGAEAANGEEAQAVAGANQEQDQAEIEGGEGPPLIYVLNLVNTKQDSSVKRFQSLICSVLIRILTL